MPDPREQRLVAVLNEMQGMVREATGTDHAVITGLLDSGRRRDPATLNYLAATASGTLRDRYFCAGNHDREPPEGFGPFNRRWEQLVDEAAQLAHDLGFPSGRDYRP